MLRISFRNGFYTGLAFALALGIYLHFLWQPTRQVQLHSEHFLGAMERKNWSKVGEFIDPDYKDQWDQDRELVRWRLREVLRSLRNLQIEVQDVPIIRADNKRGEWRGRVALEADGNEMGAIVKKRVNALETPFELQWRQQSGKPWDWTLVGATNAGLELPVDGY